MAADVNKIILFSIAVKCEKEMKCGIPITMTDKNDVKTSYSVGVLELEWQGSVALTLEILKTFVPSLFL